MIYEFNTLSELFAVTPNCRKWSWVLLDNGKIAANLEPREWFNLGGLTPSVSETEARDKFPRL